MPIISIFLIAIILLTSVSAVYAESSSKIKPDEKLYSEFKKHCENSSVNVEFDGISNYSLSGSSINVKFSVKSKDLENRTWTFYLYTNIYTVDVTADKVFIKNKKNSNKSEKSDSKNMLKYSMKALLDELSDNGKIVKKNYDGLSIYTITLYNVEQIHEYGVDPASGYFQYSKAKNLYGENPLAEKFDGCYNAQYKAWRKK